MTKKQLTSLWIITGVAVLVLTALTADLIAHPPGYETRNESAVSPDSFQFEDEVEIQAGMQVYTIGEEVRVRVSPDPFADTIRLLPPGSRVFIQAVQSSQGQPWYRIEAGRGRNGWIPDESVTIFRPEIVQ